LNSGDLLEQLSEWSSEEDPEAVYKEFKERKTLKRKRVAAETNRIRAEKRSRGAVASAIIGRKPKPKKKKTARTNINDYGTASESENGENTVTYLDNPTPEYIEARKRKLKKLHEAGLRYPPCYDNIDFSDSESEQKPKIRDINPQRKKRDLRLRGLNSIVPAPIAQWLRDYQVEGVQFLHDRFVRQTGAILGDDMGLGKTIQVIAFLTAAFGKSATKCDAKRMRKVRRIGDNRWYPRILIVCPGTLMDNWSAELEKWGWWVVSTYHGNPKDRKGVLAAAMNGRLEIMITTYNTYRINESEINTVDWDCVIADECHQMKSGHAEITKAMNKVNALCRIGLTGTAIQNKYEELWNLLNWARPGDYGSAQSWRQDVCLPLKIGQAHDASFAQLAHARSKAEELVENILPDIFLRRMKTLIADQLPKKSDRVVFCQLTETQADAYRAYIESDRCEYIRRAKETCDCNSGKKRGWCCYQILPDDSKWVYWMFPAMVTLQKLANHVALLLPNTSDKKDKHEKDMDNLQLAFPTTWPDLYRIKDKIFDQAKSEYCGKWKVLKRLLDFWYSNNDKVLVFSHSVRLLRLLKKFFDLDGTKYNLSYLDGSMDLKDRAAAVANFNSDPNQFVFLISTKAGGVGLNITSANKVVVMDPNWNPAYDLQAQDRAYRIGQTRDVEVFRLVCSGTIEEIVYARQIYKQQQANIGYTASKERRYFKGVMDEKDKAGELFGLENLFSFKEAGYILKEIVHNTNVAETRAGVTALDFTLNDDDDDASDEDDVLSNQSLGITGDGDGEYSQMKRFADMATSQDSTRVKKRLVNRGGPDPINAILAKAGVQYTHENSEVIGRSKIETELGKRAMEFRNDIELGRKRVFNLSQSQSQPREDGGGSGSNRGGIDEEDQEEDDHDMVGQNKQGEFKINYRYRPDEAIRKRQFCSMAKMMGDGDPIDFALRVERMTQEERRKMLERFYQARRRQIKRDLKDA
jgi:SNF2 family DNA or RNA helicase